MSNDPTCARKLRAQDYLNERLFNVSARPYPEGQGTRAGSGRVGRDAFADEGRTAAANVGLGGMAQLQHRHAGVRGRLVPGAELLEGGEIAVDRLVLRQLD